MKPATLLLALTLLALPPGAAATPREISPAEREAVTIVAQFLAEGAGAIYKNLAPDAPLRALPETLAKNEIFARTGPTKGATWTLQTAALHYDPAKVPTAEEEKIADVVFHLRFPSGVEDGLLFRMTRVGDTWTIREIISLGEPLKTGKATAQTVAEQAKRVRLGLLIAAACFLAIGALLRRHRAARAVFVTLGGLGLATALWFMVVRDQPEELVAKYMVQMPFVELRELVSLRSSVARGTRPTLPRGLSGETRDVANLWLLLSGAPLEKADPKVVLGSAAATPLGELLRGRIAVDRGDRTEATRAFESAATARPLRDDMVMAAAVAFGELEHITASVVQLVEMGSRDASVYYSRAMLERMRGNDMDRYRAAESFALAHQLEPLAREDLARSPMLFGLAGRSTFAAREPFVVAKRPASNPIPLPPGSIATLSGEYLRLEINGARLEVPNGAALAPRTSKVLTPTEWQRVRQQEALRDAERLLATPERVRLPALASRRRSAANALAKENRWPDFLKLTDGIDQNASGAAPQLLGDRMTALLRSDRLDEARALAGSPAVQELMKNGRAPGLLVVFGDAMMGIGAFDLAGQLYRSVNSGAFDELVQARLRSLESRLRLARGAATVPTPHFEIRYDAAVEQPTAEAIGQTFETMFREVDAKLPPSRFRRVVVNVLSAPTFHNDIAGSDHILGLYDGEILLPYATGTGVTPKLVSVITHELTHALVAAATTDNAPRWFQEGIAQHFEPGPRLLDKNRPVMPVQVLDSLMSNPLDPKMMVDGYHSARALMRYLEERYPGAAADLVRAFSQRNTTEQALTSLTGRNLDSLNVDFFAWYAAAPAESYLAAPWTAVQQAPAAADPAKEKIEIRWSRRPQ